jgi:pyruvate-formate lyase-activating enzyme
MEGETGVCKVAMPSVASATLHPAPPESYTVFIAGCNFKCLNCQNWTISQYPDNESVQRGFVDPAFMNPIKRFFDHSFIEYHIRVSDFPLIRSLGFRRNFEE